MKSLHIMAKEEGKTLPTRTINNPLSDALRALNTHVSKHLQKGHREYFCRDDLIDTYTKYNGRCAICGLYLQARGRHKRSANFMFKLGLAFGGEPSKANLLLVCPEHCKDLAHKRVDLIDRAFNFNAFSDLIVQLVNATIEKDLDRITYYKICVDNAMAEFIGNLRYVPIGKPKDINMRAITDVPISDCVSDITEKLISKLKEINLTKQYVFLRKRDE